MPLKCTLITVLLIFYGNGDIRHCSCYRGIKLLEYGMQLEDNVLGKRLHKMVIVNKCNLALCLRGTIDLAFILRRLHCCIVCVLWTCRNPLTEYQMLESAMRKKGIPEVLVISVMCQYEGAKTRVRVDSELSEEFEVKVGIHQGSMLSHFLLAVVVDVVTELAREGALSELLYADDLGPMSETIKALRNKFLKWKEPHEGKCLKANLGKTKVKVSDSITGWHV